MPSMARWATMVGSIPREELACLLAVGQGATKVMGPDMAALATAAATESPTSDFVVTEGYSDEELVAEQMGERIDVDVPEDFRR